MSSCREVVVGTLLAAACLDAGAQRADLSTIGRPATASEIAAWDIDVRPDFKGLPSGSGSVARGQEIWEAKCASCHGVFGESGEVFTPIVGGTTAADVRTGRVARLTDPSYPGRTTLMKLSSVASLWDYIRRAMPWAQPKSLSADEVYAVTAYILHLGDVLPADFVMSDGNIAEVQQRLPNRAGMTTQHGLWPGREFGGTPRPDVRGSSCRTDCRANTRIASSIPDFARNAHGNLAAQNRLVGAQLGADTTRPAATSSVAAVAAARHASASGLAVATSSGTNSGQPTASASASASRADAPAGTATATSAFALAQSHGCVACHGMGNRVIGPALQEIGRKYATQPDAAAYLTEKIRAGGSGVWGSIPMPPQNLPESDAQAIGQWLARGAAP